MTGDQTGQQLDIFGELHDVVIHGKPEYGTVSLFQWQQDQGNIERLKGCEDK